MCDEVKSRTAEPLGLEASASFSPMYLRRVSLWLGRSVRTTFCVRRQILVLKMELDVVTGQRPSIP